MIFGGLNLFKFDNYYRHLKQFPSFGTKMDGHGGFGLGFDFCRIYLALSVLVWHSWMLVQGPTMLDEYPEIPGLWLLKQSTLPMFFALSGFLIAGSAQRLSCKNFLINRGLRIFPALSVEVILSVFILGPIFTTLSLHHYFNDPKTGQYFFNIVGYIHYFLPGVFTNNPFAVVNGSLWTVPVEIICYALITIVILRKATNKAMWLIGMATVYPLIWFGYMEFYYEGEIKIWGISYLFELFFHFAGIGLIPCFLMGIAFYAVRYRLPHGRILFVMSLVVLMIIAFVVDPKFLNNPVINIIINPLLVYVILYLGLCKIPKIPFYSSGDYSYGVYLYAYPLQQALISLWPHITIPVHLGLSVLIVSIFAAFSWHCIEKPILGLRKNFSFVSRRRRF